MDFDEKAAFFAVYDGHGGSEVAEYCSQKLPQFLKQLESFKAGNYEQALKDAFIKFDATLLEEKIIEELRHLARKNPDYEDSDMDEDDETEEEINNLHQEATMPLNEVLDKYKGNSEKIAKIQTVQMLMNMIPKKKEVEKGGPSSSGSGSKSHSSAVVSDSEKTPKKSASDNEVSSSSSKPVSENDSDTAEPSSSSAAIPTPAPDSTHTIPALAEGSSCSAKKPEQSTTTESSNGERKISQKSNDDETISSSSAQENGEASSSGGTGSSSTAVVATSQSSPKISNHISSSSLPDTESDSSDDENDETYKESPAGPKPVDSDGDTTDEDMDGDDEELEDEEISGEEEEEEDGETFDDEFMNNMESGPGKASGCTAVVALMQGRELFVANAGDSRCVVCRSGKVVEMSFDHKPEDDIEFERIRKAGGRVSLDGRVNGGLNLSRAIGDHGYKMNKELSAEEQMISAMPDLKRHTLEPEDEFMVLACDGIWNYMTNEEVVGFVKQRIDDATLSLAEICEEVRMENN